MKPQEFKELQTQRLDLKPMVATFAFANELFNIIVKHRDKYKYIPKLAGAPNAESEFDFLRGVEKGWKNKTKATYGMYLRDGGAFIGACSMFNIDWDAESCEIGAWVDMDYAGKGFMTEAVNAITTAFIDMGFKRVVIKANTENLASCKVAEKCGFEREGVLRSCEFNPYLNKREDFAIFSKINDK